MIPDERAEADRKARSRFWLLNLVRIGGAAMVLLGLAVTEGVLPWPREAGYALVALGFVEFFFAPRMLARGWRTPNA